MREDRRKYILFGIQGRKFAIDIEKVKKVEKDKGNSLGIVPVEGAKSYVIGIGEIEVAQGDKRLIPFIDLRKVINMDELGDGGAYEGGGETVSESKDAEFGLEEDIVRKRRIFLIVSFKNDYLGILIDELLEILEVEENRNAQMYPPPLGVPDIFEKVIVMIEGSEEKETKVGGEKIFSINVESLERYI